MVFKSCREQCSTIARYVVSECANGSPGYGRSISTIPKVRFSGCSAVSTASDALLVCRLRKFCMTSAVDCSADMSSPYICDRFGRKPCIAVGCVLLCIGAALQGASTSFNMFIGARFLVGFGNTITQLSSPLLLTEICHPQHRSRVTAVYNCLWNLGAVVATW